MVSFAQVAQWLPREQQIFPAELYAVPRLIQQQKEALRGQDCIFFVDNDAAVAALVRVNSTQRDAAFIVQVVHAMLTMLHCRGWFEWVDTKSNQADGLSRVGLAIPEAQGFHAEWLCKDLPEERPWNFEESPWALAAELLR